VSGDQLQDLSELWIWFADHSTRGYSPVYDAVCRGVASDRELLGLISEAPPTGHLPPLLLASVHYLVLGGLDHPLAAVYGGDSGADPVPLFRDLCLAHRSEVLELLASRRVQTNEVGRSSLIGPALSWAADRLGEPVSLIDVGSSAGLNMLCDQFLLDYGPLGTIGPRDSDVVVECRVVSGSPPLPPRLPAISERLGVDLDPPDLSDPDDARWLLACVWPGTDRLVRTERAIALARVHPPSVIAGDALQVLPGLLERDTDGVRCVVTTWSFAYLRVEQRPVFIDILARAGRGQPVVWIACDGRGVVELVDPGEPAEDGTTADVMSAVTFDRDGPHPEVLGFVHSHGRWLDWRAA